MVTRLAGRLAAKAEREFQFSVRVRFAAFCDVG
jgi:hypothetical protein